MRDYRHACTLTTTPLLPMLLPPIPPVPRPRRRHLHTRHRVAANVTECHRDHASNYGPPRSHTASDMQKGAPVIRAQDLFATPCDTECQRTMSNNPRHMRPP